MRLSAGRGSAPGFIPVTDGVYLLREPFGGTTTGIILLRSAENILIDAGGSAALVDSVLVPALAALGLAPRDIDVLTCTHTHGDHIGGFVRMRELGVKQIAAYIKSVDKIRDPLYYNVEIRRAFPENSPPPSAGLVGTTVDTALRESRIERERLDGIGISVSGNVDFEDGVIVSGRNFGLPWNENVPVAAVLGDRYGVGVYAVTTQAAAPAAEYHFGTMAGCRNLLTLGFGVGIGSGVVSEGQLLISRPGRPVGHIGHMLISDNKRVCVCGFRGCLEAYSGGNSLVQVAHEHFPARTDFTDARAIDLAAGAGDADARSILDTAAVYNAAGIASMIQLYVPDAIIFGGGQCREDGYLYRRTLEEIRNILPRERLENIKVSITTLGKYQSALGAARLAYEKFFGETK